MGLAAIGVVLLTFALAGQNAPADRFWPQWRGPHASGAASTADPPTEWSETRNIRWKVEIPGRGTGSPVAWGDRIYLLSAVPAGIDGPASHEPRGQIQPRELHRFLVMAIDRHTGRVVWERTARETRPAEPSMVDGTWASSSAITDGRRVFAFFESSGLYAYDVDGNLLWQRQLGAKKMFADVGESGSTPVLHDDRLVVVWDHQGTSFIVALDAATGRELWRAGREEVDSWATPLVVVHEGRPQVVTAGQNRVRSYDLETGRLVWEGEGLTMNPIPSPVAADGLVFLTSGFQGSALQAIRLDEARGDVTGGNAIAWTLDRDTPYVPSPLLYRGSLYLLKSNSGILSAFEARTGRPHYQGRRLPGISEVYASPVAARDRVYVTGRDGTTLVIRHGPTFEVLATNMLDDGFDASAALLGGDLYLRGYRYLYDIAEIPDRSDQD